MTKELLPLDFSKGIYDEEVMYNFNLLMQLLANERLNIAGWGYITGLEVTYEEPDLKKNHFRLNMDAGTLINQKGNEVDIEARKLYVEFFNTVRESEIVTIDEDGTFEVKHFPYVKNGYNLLEHNEEDITTENIEILAKKASIKIKSISGKTITVDSRHAGTARVNYYRADPKFDIITYAEDGRIRIHKGIESTSQSFYETYKDEIVIAIVESIPHEYPDRTDAILKITQMWEINQRKIWYDRINGILYICGVPFDGTQIIHMVEPENPKENTLWYDHSENVIKIWRTVQGVSRWLVISDKSFMRKTHNKVWAPGDLPSDMQTFMFEDDMALHYAAGTNSLEIIIDNSVLMMDEYTEIINEKEQHPDYFNQGIGFKLNNPLIQPAFVEVRVTHEKRFTPKETRFERSGVYIDEKRLPIPYEKTTFETDTKFLKNANQLELYLNGIRLVNEVDYEEIELEESLVNEEYNYCNMFTLKKPVKQGDRLIYRVTANLISYNDLSVYMEDILTYYEEAEDNTDKVNKELLKINEKITLIESEHSKDIEKLNAKIKSMEEVIETLLSKESFEEIMNDKLHVIEEIDMEVTRGNINAIQYNQYKYEIDELLDDSFLNITVLLLNENEEKFRYLIREIDYIIDGTTVRFLNTGVIDNAKTLYINGITYKTKGVK